MIETMGLDGSVLPPHVAHSFGAHREETVVLSGGTRPVFRAGNVVLKQIHQTSLEHSASPLLFDWIAPYLHDLEEDGFRLARPIPLANGAWRTDDGWTAWTYVAGRPAAAGDVAECVSAIARLHDALRRVPHHPLLDANTTVFGQADRACWDARPQPSSSSMVPVMEALYALRRPMSPPPSQVVHCDLNPGNLLVAPGLPPAVIDVAPFWNPAAFAMAIFANWIGPRRGDVTVLRYFEAVPGFDQLLVRAAIRMLLIMRNADSWDSSPERRAAGMVIDYLSSR